MAQEYYFCKDFIVVTVCVNSVHFRYIYSTHFIFGPGIVRSVNLFREIFIFTQLPGLGRLIVEAEVKTNFLSYLRYDKNTKSQSKAPFYPIVKDNVEDHEQSALYSSPQRCSRTWNRHSICSSSSYNSPPPPPQQVRVMSGRRNRKRSGGVWVQASFGL